MKKYSTLVFFLLIVFGMSAQTSKSGNISVNETWTQAGGPYEITGNVTVLNGVTLTIQTGTVIRFNSNTRLTSLGDVNATNANFISNQGTKAAGDWAGLFVGIGSSSGNINLTNCNVQHGVSNQVNNGTLTLNGTTISNFSGDAILITNTLANLDIKNSSNITSSNYPISYRAAGAVTFTGNNDLTGNNYDLIYISNYLTSLTTTLHLPLAPIPYYFYGLTVRSSGELSIASNNVLKFRRNSGLTIEGKLTANANPNEFIYFTSIEDDNWGGIDDNKDGSATSGDSQDWYGIIFSGSDPTSSMVRCQVRYAGYYLSGAIKITNASPTLNFCEIQSSYYGIYINGLSQPNISNTNIGSSDITPIAMSFEADPIFSNNTLSFSDNKYDAIGLLGGTLTGDAHIIQRDFTNVANITYFMLGEIVVPNGMTLTIDPGIVIKSDNKNYNIIIHGKMEAIGITGSPIVFTSVKDDNHGNPGDTNKDGTTTTPAVGNFGGIFFTDGSDPSSLLKYCIIKYTDAANERYFNRNMGGAGVITVNSSPTIDSCEFKDMTYGIKCYEASNPTLMDNRMVNISKTPFNISGSSDPIFIGNTYSNVGWNAVGLIGGDVSQNGTIKKRNVAGFTNITYVLTETMTIANGTNIDVEPGVVLKIDQYVSILVNGGFQAIGTTADKIYFTSIKNDNVGNPTDTNGDGDASKTNPGDWDRIRFEEGSDDTYCKIENVEISYAGGNWGGYYYSGIEFNNSDAKVKNTLISSSARYGTRILGNSKPTFENVTIQNCYLSPVGMSLTSDPSFVNMTFTSNADKMLAILEGDLSSDATLKKRSVAGFDNIAYKIGNLTIKSNASLTLEKGIILKSLNGRIYVEGALIADGTTDEKIIFTSVKDDSPLGSGDSNDDGVTSVPDLGDWYGIEFKSSGISNTNLLDFCQIKYARWSVVFRSTSGTLSNSLITLSSEYGVQVIGSADPNILSNEFINIALSGAHISLFSNPTFSGNTLANIGIYGISLVPETYNQSNIVKQRNFAGYTNVTYYMNGNYGINEGTTITIPKGTIFKSMYRYYASYIHHANLNVKGKLMIEGTPSEPVVFTGFYDDAHGTPSDLGDDGPNDYMQNLATWITFENVSNDTSVIDNAIFKYAIQAIDLRSASPTISNTHIIKTDYGIVHSGVSKPKILNNTFTDLKYTPLKISLVAYPEITSGNIVEGSTWTGIEVNDETLTQDVRLPKRDFGGVTNIPYVFGNYKIGTSAGLKINPGVVLKFKDNARLTVERLLQANGGSTPDSTIKFTSIYDDFYGGDTNKDSIATNTSNHKWYGLHFVNEAIDDSCFLDNVVIAHTRNYGAVTSTSSSPKLTNLVINDAYDGLQANAASNPSITHSDFLNINRFAVNNVSGSFILNAENNWWGDNSGPKHATNPSGVGHEITDNVDYTPFRTNGVNKPITGDVSLNGIVQSFDASLVLQKVAALISLTPTQELVAEVSGDGNITSFDASLILKHIVNNSQTFPVELKSAKLNSPSLNTESRTCSPGDEITIPLFITNANNLSVQANVNYNNRELEFVRLSKTAISQNSMLVSNDINGNVFIGIASGTPLQDGKLIELVFKVKHGIMKSTTSEILINNLMFNEDESSDNITALVNIITINTALQSINKADVINAYPNPFTNALSVKFSVKHSTTITLRLLDISGREIAVLTHGNYDSGIYNVNWSSSGGNKSLKEGIYLLELQRGSETFITKVIAQ